MSVKLELVAIEKPADTNVIIGQSHFIKSAEDLYEAMANAGGGIRFGIAFLEASGACKVRVTGNDDALMALAGKNAMALGTGHAFLIFMDKGFPINVLNNVKAVPEVCSIYCATANPVQVVVASSEQGRGILGVIDGAPPNGLEDAEDVAWRQSFLRKIGYKL
ncbi:MAG: adenosine-specific kinase [Bacillota bacterium]